MWNGSPATKSIRAAQVGSCVSFAGLTDREAATAISDNVFMAPGSSQVNSGNLDLIREHLGYLRVEKGLRPLSCEAYQRDLLQFAEYLEKEDALLAKATREHIAGFLEHLGKDRKSVV